MTDRYIRIGPFEDIAIYDDAEYSEAIETDGVGKFGVIETETFSSSTTVAFTGVITPAQIISNQNDYNPTGWSISTVMRIASDAAWDITGIADGHVGRIMVLNNVGSFNITIKNNSVSSIAENRFLMQGDVVLLPNESAMFIYDDTDNRWRILSHA